MAVFKNRNADSPPQRLHVPSFHSLECSPKSKTGIWVSISWCISWAVSGSFFNKSRSSPSLSRTISRTLKSANNSGFQFLIGDRRSRAFNITSAPIPLGSPMVRARTGRFSFDWGWFIKECCVSEAVIPKNYAHSFRFGPSHFSIPKTRAIASRTSIPKLHLYKKSELG